MSISFTMFAILGAPLCKQASGNRFLVAALKESGVGERWLTEFGKPEQRGGREESLR
ncbi:MAG: hypothetical protein ACE361_01850 [Aureliella sp.]